MSPPPFTAEQIVAYKRDKQLWNWDSPYGPLAVHYIEKGTGDNHILLIHGFRAHTYTWRHLIEPLAEAGYHVWAVDLVGYGLSDKPKEAPYDPSFFVAQLADFMEGQGISSAHIIGNSMGGGLTLNLALKHPHLIQSLTLISALGYPLEFPLSISIMRSLGSWGHGLLNSWIIEWGLKQVVFDPSHVTPEQVAAYTLPYSFPGGAYASLKTLTQFDNQLLVKLGEQYSSLAHLPILVVWGAGDPLIPFCHYEQFIRDFPLAERLLIPDCGHIPQEEAPAAVLTALLKFLNQQLPFTQDH